MIHLLQSVESLFQRNLLTPPPPLGPVPKSAATQSDQLAASRTIPCRVGPQISQCFFSHAAPNTQQPGSLGLKTGK